MKLKTGILVAVTCFALAMPGVALAQSPTQDAYGGAAGEQQGVAGLNQGGGDESPAVANEAGTSAGTEAVAVDSDGGGTLPFTGLELALIGAAGIGLLAMGFALYRTSHRPESQG